MKRIYVDIDDVLAQTIARLLDLLEQMYDRRVALHEIEHFDLSKSFRMDRSEIETFMERAHDDDILESIAPTPGAVRVLASWADAGHRIALVTGRPPLTNAASRRWLDLHDFSHETLHHLDKWSRPSWNSKGLPSIGFKDIPNFEFDFAVEDNLDTAVRLVEEFGIPVALLDRPWNRATDTVSEQTRELLVRCQNWEDVDRQLESIR